MLNPLLCTLCLVAVLSCTENKNNEQDMLKIGELVQTLMAVLALVQLHTPPMEIRVGVFKNVQNLNQHFK